MRIKPAGFQLRRCLALALLIAPSRLCAQGHPSASGAVSTGGMIGTNAIDVDVSVRDAHGNVIDAPAVVHLTSAGRKYNATFTTEGLTPARFHQIMMGEYEVEVSCPGFQRTKQTFLVDIAYSGMPVYVYLVPESGSKATSGDPPTMLAPEYRSDLERGIEALRKGRYSAAQKTLAKLATKTHNNPDVLYNLGLAELGLKQDEQARSAFQRALATDPNHEPALVALAQLEMRNGSPATAVPLLEKAASSAAANWRTDYDLASADLKLDRLSQAESAASRAVRLARNQSAAPTYLLGQIQYAAGQRSHAKAAWESMLKDFPSDPLTEQARKNLSELDFTKDSVPPPSATAVASPVVPEPAPAAAVAEHAWAPPDIDEVVPDVAPDVSCNTETVLDQALHRMKLQLLDLEKFTATERIEQWQIDRYGWPGPVKSREFSYIVLVSPMVKDSMYVQEYRNGSSGTSGMDNAIITTSLNSLGINILQPYYRDRFNYLCEGLSHVRGVAAWQVHFVQKADVHDGVRSWKTNRKNYDIPIKGRLWISSLNFSVLRVETDLREPVKELQLTRDHLLVDYGPVDFTTQSKHLWLPWSAEMFTELQGQRYRNRHTLTHYMLFAIDTSEKVAKPREEPPR